MVIYHRSKTSAQVCVPRSLLTNYLQCHASETTAMMLKKHPQKPPLENNTHQHAQKTP